MKHSWLAMATAAVLVGSSVFMSAATDPGVTLIGTGKVSAGALDLSGLTDLICALDINKNVTNNCIDKRTLGGFGSGLAYTGHDDVYLAVPDRGPFDGRTSVPYLDRFHFMQITVDTSTPFPPATPASNVNVVLLDTRFLMDNGSRNFVGDAYAFSTIDPLDTLRFDPEGVIVSPDGTFFVSDEYGPYVRQFNRMGHLMQRLPVPSKFLLDPETGHQSGDVDSGGNSLELTPNNNSTGRQANRGMEGLAITPDGRTLVGIMQNALIQDNGLVTGGPGDAVPGRRGLVNRILTIDLQTGETHEYAYVVDAINQGRGVNEILAINDHEFLVLERDNRTFLAGPTNDPRLKRIYRIDLKKNGVNDVTDVSGTANLPETAAGLALQGIVPVAKTLFLDMLNPDYKVDATHTIKDVIAEKIEGMAWGPDLADGRHLLLVMSDNDLGSFDTQIYAFAIAASALDYQPQQLPEPLFSPGQLKKTVE